MLPSLSEMLARAAACRRRAADLRQAALASTSVQFRKENEAAALAYDATAAETEFFHRVRSAWG
jgi:hypothetical protein